jgi:hypothetical protein
MFIKSFPDEIDLLGFFESEPVVSDTDDLHFAYKTNDDNGVELILCYCWLDKDSHLLQWKRDI